MIGMKYGRLTVLRFEESRNQRRFWRCVCDCGNEAVVMTKYLNNGDTKSCGCLMREAVRENAKGMHKKSPASKRNPKFYIKNKRHPLVSVLKGMNQRCNNEKCKNYKWYGGKGVKVCEEWKNTENFIVWAENNGYKKGLTIDRIDPSKDYSPENCRFITRSENVKRSHKASRVNLTPCGDYYPEIEGGHQWCYTFDEDEPTVEGEE